MIVRPNLWQKGDTDLEWGVGYRGFAIITSAPGGDREMAVAEPLVTFQMVVDDKDPGFSSSGAWQEEPGLGYGGAARSILSTDPTNLGPSDDTAWSKWTPQLPYDGMWEVMAWMPIADQDDTTAHIATYRVTHAEGMSLVRRSQRDAVQGWMSLGVFPMAKGDRASVYLGNLTGDSPPRKVWADSVRLVWRAPILVRAEEDESGVYLVQDGLRRRIADADTLAVLRLSNAEPRKLSPLALEQYPSGEPLPSIYASWVGQYFNNTFLAPPAAMLRQDPAVNFSWGNAAPSPSAGETGFSARWSRIMAFSEGVYPFAVEAVGGVRLWIDGQLLIDDWDASNILIRRQQELSVTAGLHRIEVEYVNRDGFARATFSNLPPNVPLLDDAPAGDVDGHADGCLELARRQRSGFAR